MCYPAYPSRPLGEDVTQRSPLASDGAWKWLPVSGTWEGPHVRWVPLLCWERLEES